MRSMESMVGRSMTQAAVAKTVWVELMIALSAA